MKKQKNENTDGVLRNRSLIAGRTGKLALTNIATMICSTAVTVADSLVAGISIGSAALAAIAAAAPFLAIGEILHCLLGYGIDKLMIRAIGKGKRLEANRIFGAVLIAVVAVYLIVYIPMLLFIRPLFSLFIKDPVLVENTILYIRPLFLAAPVMEVLLCIERAFRVDGRAALFAQRSLITNIGNIFLDILLVSVMGMDISGLSWSSVISSLIGYIIPLSHFFSKKRTVSPDFSVIHCKDEMLSYLKADIRLGESATLDEVMESLALSAQTAVIGRIGHSEGLAIWAVFKALRGLVLSMSNGSASSVSVHTGLLYSQKDYDGVRFSVQRGVNIAVMSSLAAFVLVHAFAEGIADLYRIEPALRTVCAQCLRIGSAVFPSLAFPTVMTAYLPAVNRIKLTNVFLLVQKGLMIVGAGIGCAMSLPNFFIVYVISLQISAVLLYVLLERDRFWFVPERSPDMIAVYSVRLEPKQISAVSVEAAEALNACAYAKGFCSRAALVVEDSINYIARDNPDAKVHADIQLKRDTDSVQIVIVDDGRTYNPIPGLAEATMDKPGALEAVIVMGLSAVVNYDRVLDLNILSLDLDPAAGVRQPG